SVGTQVPASSDRPVWSIAVSPAHPAVLLEATQGHGVLRSSDSGATWTSVISSVENAWSIRFDPQQAGTVYAGTQSDGFYKSSDEGKTWTQSSQGLSSMDVRAIDANNGLIVAGTPQGVFYSNDGAVSWHSLGLSGLSIAAVGLLPKANGMSIFAGADNGSSPLGGYLLKTEDLSGGWAAVKGSFPGDAIVASLAIASGPSGGTDPPVLAGTSEGLFRSDDRGATWAAIGGLPTSDFNVALFNPANPDQIYAASDADQGNGGVFRSLDRGASWSPLGAGLPSKPRVTALTLQPLSPAEVVASTWNPTDGSVGVYRIADTAASIAGASPTATAAATARPSATARASIPAPAPVRRSSGSIAYQPYAAAAAILLALIAVLFLRRWKIRREDRRTYAP
ncbi:MAG TPA: hypothetical protein VIT43_12620, partial [Candidatus Dormibacteraeota bacterium]